MTAAPQILIAGRICLDELVELNEWPEPEIKTHIRGRCLHVGGNAARAALCAARLGASVSLSGRVADDDAGRHCLNLLKTAGVDTDLVRVIAGGATPCSHVLICGATRTVLAETNQLEPLAMNERIAAAASKADAILLDPAAAHLASMIKDCGNAPLVYDHEPAAYRQDHLLKLADYFVPGRGSLDQNANIMESIEVLGVKTAGRLIVTAGAQGAFYLDGEFVRHIAAPPIEPQDTNGAGDNFHGALTVALASRMKLEQAVKLAVAVASLSCLKIGCPAPTMSEALTLAAKLHTA